MQKTERAEKQKKQADLPEGHMDKRPPIEKEPKIEGSVEVSKPKELATETPEQFKQRSLDIFRRAKEEKEAKIRSDQEARRAATMRDREESNKKLAQSELIKFLPNGQWELYKARIVTGPGRPEKPGTLIADLGEPLSTAAPAGKLSVAPENPNDAPRIPKGRPGIQPGISPEFRKWVDKVGIEHSLNHPDPHVQEETVRHPKFDDWVRANPEKALKHNSAFVNEFAQYALQTPNKK
jgi:hypothetical protein